MTPEKPPRPDLPPGPRGTVPAATWTGLEAIPVFMVATVTSVVVGVPLTLAQHFCAGRTVIESLVGELAFAGAVLVWVRYVNRGPVAALGLPREPLKDIGFGLAAGVGLIIAGSIALFIVRAIASVIIGHEPSQPQQVVSCVRGTALGLLGPVVVLVAPFGEELFFRGFLYKGLRRKRSVAASAAISGAAFGLVHVYPLLIPALAVVGVGLALTYERRQSVLASMVAHATFNLLGFITIVMSRT